MGSIWGRAALLFALASALYLGGLSHGFHYDDFHSVVHNPHLRELDQVPRFFVDPEAFSVDRQQAMYRPLLLCTYALTYALGGEGAALFHLGNALLHGACAALVLLFARALTGQVGLAFAAGLLFAVHPLNAEVASYVSARSESLMAAFFLLSCWAWLRDRRLLALLAGLLALLSKSVAVALAPALVLCDWYRGGWGAVRRQWKGYLPFAGLALVYVFFTRQLVGRALLEPVRSLDVQLWTQCKAFAYYLFLAVAPLRLSVEHQFFAAADPLVPAVLAAGALLLSLAWVLWRSGDRLLPFGAAFFALLMAPASAVPLIVLVNEHRLYLAAVGLWLALAWMLLRPGRGRLARGSIAVYTIVLGFLAFARGQVWSDERALWSDAAGKAPLMLKPHLRLGDALAGEGQYAGAEQAYLRALALRPQHPGARNNLGRLYLQTGRLEEAEAQFRTLLEVSADIQPARLNLAESLLRRGAWQEAEGEYMQALERGPTLGVAQEKLGHIALHYRGDAALALRRYEEAIDQAPKDDAGLWSARGVALKALGRYEGAEASYRRALAIDAEHAEAWFNLGNLLRDTGRLDEARNAYARVMAGGEKGLATRARNEWNALKPNQP